MDDISDRLNSLSPERRALLALRLKKGGGLKQQTIPQAERAAASAVQSRVAEEITRAVPEARHAHAEHVTPAKYFPPSFAQQRLWFLNQLEPESSFYNLPFALRIEGGLNASALERALDAIVERHEMLRTTFATFEGRPEQLVAPFSPVSLRVIDLGSMPETEREREARRLRAEEAQLPFDLTRGPLLRTMLLRLGEREHVFLLTMHHIIADGWSVDVFVRELTVLYLAFVEGKPSPLSPLPIQYSDYAVWQRRWLQGEVLESQLSYWLKKLAGAPEVLELPADYQRPVVQRFRGATQSFDLDAGTLTRLKQLSQREGATLFMTLLAAFKVLLYRHSRQEDIVVGTPVAGRNRSETEGLIGFFVNTLVLRTEVSGRLSFRELLRRVREVTLDADAHQDLPFEKLVDELQLDRNLSHTPLFNVAFTLQGSTRDSAGDSAGLSGLTMRPVGGVNTTAKFDLTLDMLETPSGLHGSLEYSTDLFEAATVARMIQRFRTLLESILTNPDQRLSRLAMLAEEERRRVLYEFNPQSQIETPTLCLHQLFERQAARTPDATALTFDSRHLTYRQLDARASRLARLLRSRGLGPDTLVALLVERSEALVVSILGTLKAGAAYLPLDPSSPADRLSFMLADSGARVLVVGGEQSRSLAGELAADGVTVIDLDLLEQSSTDDALDADGEPVAGVEVSPDNLAYVIYTSGSTGRPKGVSVTHGNVTRLFSASDQHFRFTASDVWTLFHSAAFDFSVWELWGALLYGGRLVVVPYWVSRTPDAFRRLLAEEGVTMLSQTPSAFRQLMAEDERVSVRGEGDDLSLRGVVFGGEALEMGSLRGWVARRGAERPRLINMYGITETTVHVTFAEVGEREAMEGGASRIGRALSDLAVYVLDGEMEAAGVGVTGEFYVGGAGVARGYLGRPGLTAERFVPDPFGDEEGARLYRTGDLGRYREDGELEYAGRADDQVKVRGFRIELGEVESAVRELEGVAECVVVARGEGGGDRRLVAYVVGEGIEVAELRRVLKERLPEYMIPASFVVLDRLPLTANGKVDKRALPAPGSDGDSGGERRGYVAPRDEVEALLCEVWGEVLRVERVGVEDNFFALGGDSMSSVQVLAKSRERGLNFSLQHLFQSQTIRELAAKVERAGAGVGHAGARKQPFTLISEEDRRQLPGDVEDAYPLTLLQTGMLFHSEFSPESVTYINIASYHLRAPFDERALREALKRLVKRHSILRTSFELAGFSQPLQLVHRSVPAPVEFEDLRRLTDDEQREALEVWMRAEKRRKFDWTKAPLMRIHVSRRSDETLQFSMTHHHAILDGWSEASLLTELFKLYLSLLKGEADTFAPLASTFGDYVELEQQTLKSDEARRFWKSALSGATASRLPRRPHPGETPPSHNRNHVVEITQEISDGLKQLAASASVPIKSVLLAAHLRVLSYLTGQRDVVTGIVSHGRPEVVDGERVLGLFLNTLPFRVRLPGGAWDNLSTETFRAEQELLPFRHYPVSQMQSDRGGEPPYDTLFNFTHFRVYQNIRSVSEIEVLNGAGVGETNFALSVDFNIDYDTARVGLLLSYNAAQFADAQIEAIGNYYLNALTAMSREPSENYEAASLLTEPERVQLLDDWNSTARRFESARIPLHELFERRAALTPDAVALVCGEHRLTYRQLDARSNQMARLLVSRGLRPDGVVGLCLPRSTDLVVSMLAALKAGGAYLPLDPQYPRQRLAFMLEDSGAGIVLTHANLRERIGECSASVLCLDEEREETERQEKSRLLINVDGERLAYVIYTSGSTGRPKGVMIPHRAIVNHMLWMLEQFEMGDGESVLQKTASSFDASVWEFYAPLLCGGRLVLARDGGGQDADYLIDSVREHGVRTLQVVPTMLSMLLGTGRLGECASLRRVFCGGEALSGELWESFEAQTAETGAELVNLYGPTEATIDALWHACVRGEREGDGVLLGRPVANLRAYVLDERMGVAPLGVAGELYVGGEGLARGYMNRPGLTAERFVPDPFSHEGGARLYRTGDVVRYVDGGELEFVGRADDQVKVRGYRVELGEVESAVRELEGVGECVVVAREDEGGDRRLAAYVVRTPGGDGDEWGAAQWRGSLKGKLPEYMIPASFVVLDRLPLTANGKVDRRALPAPGSTNMELKKDSVPPRDVLELKLTQIWEEVLGVQPVGVQDEFFEIGGDSILAVRLMARIQQATGQKIPLQTLIAGGTVERLSSLLRGHATAGSGFSLVTLQALGSKTPFFCVHAVGGGVLSYLDLARRLGTDRPFYGLQAQGFDDGRPPLVGVEAMAARYLGEIRAVQPEGPYLLGGWSMGGVIAFEMARQLHEQGQSVALLALLDSHVPAPEEKSARPERARMIAEFAQDLGVPFERLDISWNEFAALDPDEQLTFVLERAKDARLVPEYVDLETAEGLFKVYEANVRALSGYEARAQECRVQLFAAAERATGRDEDAALGWRDLATQGVEIHRVAGDHYTMMRGPHVEALAEELRAQLERI